jgi:hypothetical protein
MDDYIQFDVTVDDIAAGRKNNPNVCPMALAIKRAINNQFQVGVGWKHVTIYGGPIKTVTKNYQVREGINYLNPYEAWVRAFDRGYNVRPFAGQIERESTYVRQIHDGR